MTAAKSKQEIHKQNLCVIARFLWIELGIPLGIIMLALLFLVSFILPFVLGIQFPWHTLGLTFAFWMMVGITVYMAQPRDYQKPQKVLTGIFAFCTLALAVGIICLYAGI